VKVKTHRKLRPDAGECRFGADGGVFLIDSGAGGWGGMGGELPAALAGAGIAPEDVRHILVTHMHGDHVGGLVRDGRPAFERAEVLVAKAEYDYWMSEAALRDADEARRVLTMRIRECAEVYRKAGKLSFFTLGEKLSAGVQSVDLSGHTPGHSGFLLESAGKKLLFIGDLIHGAALQMPRPDITVTYDVDQPAAGAARLRVLPGLARDRTPIAGAHLPFPGIGTVRVAGDGYALDPVLGGRSKKKN
jgi:glyoxylase-like metal-dependent hydrolase (beta-lactamase superfamily II)